MTLFFISKKKKAEQAVHTLSQRVITIARAFPARGNYHMTIGYRIESYFTQGE